MMRPEKSRSRPGLRAGVSSIGDADAALLSAMARGERRALEVFYDRHVRTAFAFALRMLGTVESAEDVVQDVFVTLWRRASDYRGDAASPRTWLLAMLRNRCIDELRGRSRRFAHERFDDERDEQPHAIANDPWPEIWKQHCGDILRTALAELTEEQRTSIELAFYDGFSHSQISERLCIPLGTVKKRIRSGIQRLRSHLDRSFAE